MKKQKSMFTSRKQQNDEATQAVVGLAQEVFPHLLELDVNSTGVELVGVSVGPAKSGDGFIAVGKLSISEDTPLDAFGPGLDGTRFVVYGFGETPMEAVCNIEAQLANGTANLVKDRYAS